MNFHELGLGARLVSRLEALSRWKINRRRQIRHDGVEKFLHSLVPESRTAQDRHKIHIERRLAHVHANIYHGFSRFSVCHRSSHLLNSSLELIRLFEIIHRVGPALTLVNDLLDRSIIELLNRLLGTTSNELHFNL